MRSHTFSRKWPLAVSTVSTLNTRRPMDTSVPACERRVPYTSDRIEYGGTILS